MSSVPTITVLVGQCGNQLGFAWLDAIAIEDGLNNDGNISDEQFFRWDKPGRSKASSTQRRRPRCVMVDMEAKVVDTTRARAAEVGRFVVDEEQCVSREEGSANNWAFGYVTQGTSRIDAIEEALRSEVAAAADEYFGTAVQFQVIHSIAGGTGSGVGCLVSEAIKEWFPKSPLLHTVVWPFAHGEVVTQWYNTILATSFLRDTADGVLVMSNDDVARELKSRHEGGGAALAAGLHAASSFRQLNQAMAEQMAALLMPASWHGVGAAADMVPLRQVSMWDIVEHLSLDPVTKFFGGATFPRNVNGIAASLPHTPWPMCLREAIRTATTRWAAPSFLFVLRGNHSCSEGFSEWHSQLQHYTEVYSRSAIVTQNSMSSAFLGTSAHCSLFGATTQFSDSLQNALRKAEVMLEARAFLHHFERYGVAEDDLHDACLRCWEVATTYDRIMDDMPA